MQNPEKNSETPPENTNNLEFNIQRIYTKDLSFESPNAPQLFRETWQPNVDVELNVKSNPLGEDAYEVVVTITTTVKTNDKVAFLVEVHQAGIFTMKGFTQEQAHRMLGSYCPNILFPYAREIIANLVTRGGFAPLYLAPVNFDQLYDQQLQKPASPENGNSVTTH
ncbi:MAG: protein-export chaperone SecB [Gammaproteobacteria bacterium]